MPKESFQESKQVTIQNLATHIRVQPIIHLKLVIIKHIFYTWNMIINRLEQPIHARYLSM